jgi:predicted RNA binding protein YcfA (HicA-like mRNA interferase family)
LAEHAHESAADSGTSRPCELARSRADLADDGSLFLVKVRELIALIEADGWVLVRTKGSHRQFQHPTKPGTVTVAGNPGIDVPPGTLNSVLKQAALKM